MKVVGVNNRILLSHPHAITFFFIFCHC